jgi:hypothetical protein
VQGGVSPRFGDQKLVWEVTGAQLRQCRSRKVMLRVEVWRDKEMLGHLVMDLRTAVPLHTKQDEAPFLMTYLRRRWRLARTIRI